MTKKQNKRMLETKNIYTLQFTRAIIPDTHVYIIKNFILEKNTSK